MTPFCPRIGRQVDLQEHTLSFFRAYFQPSGRCYCSKPAAPSTRAPRCLICIMAPGAPNRQSSHISRAHQPVRRWVNAPAPLFEPRRRFNSEGSRSGREAIDAYQKGGDPSTDDNRRRNYKPSDSSSSPTGKSGRSARNNEYRKGCSAA